MHPEFTHLDPMGRTRIADSALKEASHRRAIARAKVFMQEGTALAIASGQIAKGDPLPVARVAGIQAAKRTSDLLPLCHPLLVGSVFLNFRIEEDHVEIEAYVDTVDRTGVEMEAMTACSVAALAIYDMCKSIDRDMSIGEVMLFEKSGGRAGTWRRAGASDFESDLGTSLGGGTSMGDIDDEIDSALAANANLSDDLDL